ncbi:MAG: glycosyltransferase [Magnetococcus sp. DMHC-1]
MRHISKQRKESIYNNADAIAHERENWMNRNRFYHQSNLDYLRFLIPEGKRILVLGSSTGFILAGLRPSLGIGMDFSERKVAIAREKYPHLIFQVGDVEDGDVFDTLQQYIPFDFILLPNTLAYLEDCQSLLEKLHFLCTEETRIIFIYLSWFWEPLLKFGQKIGMHTPRCEMNMLSQNDIQSFLHLSGFDPVKHEKRQLLPLSLFGLGTIVNRFLAPLPGVNRLCLCNYLVARPAPGLTNRSDSTSIIIPCRNEKYNIEPAIQRTPRFCKELEFIFVEGGSSDGTYEECLRVQNAYPDCLIKVFKQPGIGKGDAVRKGFAEAKGNIFMILDADLTVPPEELPKFHHALTSGQGEFINGTRMVYPMEKQAMRFLNYWANQLFSWLFSWLLNQRFTDTLCGTKVLSRKHYQLIAQDRHYFGNFDPFGDFDLIFGATKQNLKVVEIPIRYCARRYGETQISRFSHGFLLMRMVLFAFRKLKAF